MATLAAVSVAASAAPAPRVAVWPGPGGGIAASPDYEVRVAAAGRVWSPFTYHSYNRPCDKLLDVEGRYIKLAFLGLHSNEYRRPEDSRDTYAHSWTSFDFSGGPVEVEVRILRPFHGLTLPLKSCVVLPSTHGIKGRVTGPGTLRFTLTAPAKLAVVANPDLAAEKLRSADPKQAFEGYLNPLFLFARAPETDVPDRNAPGTLVARPGETRSVDEVAKARVIWFEPGLHDYSAFNADDPDHYIALRSGQTMYLAGGAYVHGVVRWTEKRGPAADMPLLRGRGTLSGVKQRWTDVPYFTTVEKGVRLDGIQIADPHNHISHSTAPVRDVAVVGAWHGNTDGFTREIPASDAYRGWHLDDCFVMAADTNLKVGGPARVRNYTVWQLSNAEPLWIRNPDGCVVDGLQVIAFNAWPSRQTVNLSRGTARNAVFRNFTIEAPYLPVLFLLTTPGEGAGTIHENVVFENVTVTTPHIARKSELGPAGAAKGAFGRVVFRNLVINGRRVTAENAGEFFDLAPGVTVGREVVFE